jgi:hypothetical protein
MADSSGDVATGSTKGGGGLGLELGYRLFDLSRGYVIANVLPSFLLGKTGSAVMVPIGLAYHFQ